MSFIQVPSAEVKKLAEECIARIEKRNSYVLMREVLKRRKSYERWAWLRRLFRLSVPSNEEIEKELRGNTYLDMDLQMYAWRSRQIAEELIKAAAHSNTVNVSSRDLDYLS